MTEPARIPLGPGREAIDAELLAALCEQVRGYDAGDLVPHLPGVAHPVPDALALAVCAPDGTIVSTGDDTLRFDLQSVSKPFVYALALQDRGVDEVARRIDVEPSGEAYNEISLEKGTGRAKNALVNAGALVAHSLVRGDDEDARVTRITDLVARLIGREPEVYQAVVDAEAGNSHRNFALAHLLAEQRILVGDPHEVVRGYGRQCGLMVDVRELAMMGAVLASGGVHPRSGERVLDRQAVRLANSIMFTCGMYDNAGDWVYQVGMPAKSGVSGCVVAVKPGFLGIAAFSPRLDEHGNSVRASKAIELLSDRLELHVLDVPDADRPRYGDYPRQA